MRCPVCKKRIKNITNDCMGNTLLERRAECADVEKLHYYSYHYHTGSTVEVVGGITFHSHYTDDDRVRILQAEQYNAVLDLERMFYEAHNRSEKESTLKKVLQYISNWFNKT